MRAVIYARFSSNAQRDESVDGQLRVCKEYAEREGLTIVGEYIDRAKTGRTDDREGFQRMMRDVTKDRFDMILVWKGDRVARNRYDMAMFRSKIKKNNVTLRSVTEMIPDTPEGIILESVLDGMAEYYSANLAQNTLRGMRENALKAKYNGSRVPFGYRIDDNKDYQIDKDKEPFVVDIFDNYLSGWTMRELADQLKRDGVTHYGRAISPNGIGTILSNPVYIGTYKFADVVLEDVIPAIIDKDTFNNVQARRAQRAASRPKRDKEESVKYLLSGKLRCGICGSVIAGDSGTSRNGETHRYYTCLGRKRKETDCDLPSMRKEDLERIVLEAAREIVLNDDIINTITDHVIEMLDQEREDNHKLQSINAAIKETESKLDNLMRSLEHLPRGSETIAGRIAELEDHLRDLKAEQSLALIEIPNIERDDLIYWLSQFKGGDIENEEFAERLTQTFVCSNHIDHENITIIFNFSPDKSKIRYKKINGVAYINEEAIQRFGQPLIGSPCWIRTNDSSVNSRMLYR